MIYATYLDFVINVFILFINYLKKSLPSFASNLNSTIIRCNYKKYIMIVLWF